MLKRADLSSHHHHHLRNNNMESMAHHHHHQVNQTSTSPTSISITTIIMPME
jgi:hypothetical protein